MQCECSKLHGCTLDEKCGLICNTCGMGVDEESLYRTCKDCGKSQPTSDYYSPDFVCGAGCKSSQKKAACYVCGPCDKTLLENIAGFICTDCHRKKYVTETDTGGMKHDSNKPDLSLFPREAIEAGSRAFMFGEKKYSRDNWRKGISKERLVAATLRHLFAWKDGELNDPESNLSHLDHAQASLAMLITLHNKGE